MLFPAETHASNAPPTWMVVKITPRLWRLQSALGGELGTYPTKRQAEEARQSSWLTKLYDKEGRWYAGEPVPGWKPLVTRKGSDR